MTPRTVSEVGTQRPRGAEQRPGSSLRSSRTAPFLLGALIGTACGIKTEVAASKFVKTQLIVAREGGTISLTSADSAALSGTRIVVFAGALNRDTLVTIGIGETPITPAGAESAGPVINLGPAGTQFRIPALLTMPFALPGDSVESQLVVDAREDDGQSYQIPYASLRVSGDLVQFNVNAFTDFEPDTIPLPSDGGDAGPDGGCETGQTRCPPLDGGTDAGYCADTTADRSNCGACGSVCPNDQRCLAPAQGAPGQCVCDVTLDGGGDLILCAGGCVHGDDPRHCGDCNVECETGICNHGVCLCNPDAGILQCGPMRCADINSDLRNCGACGIDCTAGTSGLTGVVCQAGQCRCLDGQNAVCPRASGFPALVCIDTGSDPYNCGGCGLAPDGGGPYSDGGLPPSPYVCSGVRSSCQNGTCNCPNSELYCAPGTWSTDGGSNDGGVCLDEMGDSLNCGGCGVSCADTFAANSVCQFATCKCVSKGICVITDDPIAPACTCNGTFTSSHPNPICDGGATITFSRDIYPLLSQNGVVMDGGSTGLIGCATSGCHDSTAAAGLQFTDPDASYQMLVNGPTSIENCPGNSMTPVQNPSQICLCQSLLIPKDGADSLLYQLLNNTFVCPAPQGGIADPMPSDSLGTYHPWSPCLITQVRQWIDQGAVY